jgi:hypothetical protein
MKVIFLDIDGVLNYTNWYVSERYQNMQMNDDDELEIDPECAKRIVNICNETDAKIVITSDWRLSWYGTILRLGMGGIPRNYILDKTPERIWMKFSSTKDAHIDISRGAEINDWLEANPECTNYVIIDDRTDFKENQNDNFVHVNPMYGITDENMNQAIAILNKN